MVRGRDRADDPGMRPLAPAVTELHVAGVSVLACAAALALGGGIADPRATGLGVAAAVILVWVPWGAGAVRRAIRLALPVRPRWALEDTASTVGRVLVTQTVPLAALAVGATVVGERVAAAPSAATGALAGVGACAVLAAARIRDAERTIGRRLLREPRWGRLLDRRSLFVEPAALADRPAGAAVAPWPAHRPPPRVPRAAIELEPANPSAVHAVGVGVRTLRAPPSQGPPRPPSSGS